MGWRHFILTALLIAPLAGPAQDWRDVRNQSRQQQPAEEESENRVHLYRDAPRSYIGVNIAHSRLDVGVDEDATLTALLARLGGMTSDHWGMELRLGPGGDKHTFRSETDSRDKLDLSIRYLAGVYLTGRGEFLDLPYELGSVYAQAYLGVGGGEIEAETRLCNAGSCTTETDTETESGFSYGAALGVRLRPELSVALEYMNYFDEDDTALSTIEAGIMYHF